MNRPSLSAYLAGALAIVRRDVQIFLSYRTAFITQLLGAFFSLTLFYYLSRMVQVRQFDSADAYYAFAVVGLIVLQLLNSTMQGPPGSLRSEMVAGTFERIVLSPLGPVRAMAAMLVFPFVSALVMGVAMLVFASAVFNLHVRWETVSLVVPAGVLGALSFAPFGLLLMAMVLVIKQSATGTTWIIAGISLISGLYFPVTLLPDWIQWASHVQPFTAAADVLRNVLVGTPLPDPLWLDLTKLIVFPLMLIPLASAAVNAAVRYGQRRGTIIEY